jgi:hypothetical protein
MGETETPQNVQAQPGAATPAPGLDGVSGETGIVNDPGSAGQTEPSQTDGGEGAKSYKPVTETKEHGRKADETK